MRATLLCATMLCAFTTSAAHAQQRFRLPAPEPTPTATPTPSPTPILRALPIRQTAPAPAPTPTPTPTREATQGLRAVPTRQTAPAPTPTPTPAPLVTTTAPRVRQPVQTAPLANNPPVVHPLQVKPMGKMALNIIDRGYAEADLNGARSLSIAACAADEYGNTGDIKEMRYDIDLPGGHRKGEMTMYVQPGQKPGLNSPAGKKAEIIGNCRRVTIPLKPCEIAPNEYPFTISVEFSDRAPLNAQDKTIIGEYPSKIALNPASFESGVPQTVSGTVTAPCNAASGAQVTLTSPNGPPVTLTTKAGGSFSGTYLFTKPGKATLTALVQNDANLLDSSISVAANPAAPAVIATVVNQPKLAKLGTPTTFAVRIRHATSNVALSGAIATLSYAGTSCKAVGAKDGTASCAITLDASQTNLVNTSQVLSIAVADTASVTPEGLGKTSLADSKGLMSFKFGGLVAMPIIQASRPSGVLLNSYNPGWSGTGAHLDNGSLLYPAPDFKKPQIFNIPTFNNAGFSYYLQGVLIRTDTLVLQSPARIRIPLSITGSLDGHGPRMKGFCFKLYCKIVGYDNSAPDINNIALKNGYVSIDLFVENGHVKARLGPSDGTLDFSCGGIASLVCGYIRDSANDELHRQIDKMTGSSAILGVASANIDAMIQQNLKLWNIATLTDIALDPDGSVTVTGTPLAK